MTIQRHLFAITLFILSVLSYSFRTLAQPKLQWKPVYLEYSPENGYLPTGKVSTLVFDRYGYMWLAAEKGLFRYNGRSFELKMQDLKSPI